MALADLAVASAVNSMAMLSNADVVWGDFEARAIYSMPGREVFEGQVVSEDHTLIYLTDDLPGLGSGESLTVNGASFKTRTPLKLDDGLMHQVGIVEQ
jgi:hypothetical protein